MSENEIPENPAPPAEPLAGDSERRPQQVTPRTFKSFPKDAICPMCGTNYEGECVLIIIYGPPEDPVKPGLREAVPMHLNCAIIDRWYPTDQVGVAFGINFKTPVKKVL